MVDTLHVPFDAATLKAQGAKAIAARLPEILAREDRQAALHLLNQYEPGHDWLPEALMLFRTKTLSRFDHAQMLPRIFPYLEESNHDLKALPGMLARIGRIGYSFPQWRFLAQGYNDDPIKNGVNASLLERYGLKRLSRPTDIRDSSLPPGHPDRDHFGTGFISVKDRVADNKNWHIEFRRSYVLCSHHEGRYPATIVIRNNSWFYGRDRLPEPCYVSWEKFSPEELNNLDDSSFVPGGAFIPLQDALTGQGPALDRRLYGLYSMLNFIDSEDMKISNWLRGTGIHDLHGFLKHMLGRQKSAGKTEPPLYLCMTSPAMPPWSPQLVEPVTHATLNNLLRIRQEMPLRRFTLLSGPNGDFPVRPQPPNVAQNGPAPAA